MNEETSQSLSFLDPAASRESSLLARNPQTADTRLEAYLRSVVEPIESEMRDHLESLVAAHLELGASEEEAVERAIEQFGNAGLLAQSWTRPRRSFANLPSARTAFRWAGIAAAGTLLLTGDRINYDSWAWLLFLTALGLPVCAGLVGGASESRPFRAAAKSLTSLIPWLYATFVLWALLPMAFGRPSFLRPLQAAGLFGTLHLAGWFAAGFVGTAIGAALRRTGDYLKSRVTTR